MADPQRRLLCMRSFLQSVDSDNAGGWLQAASVAAAWVSGIAFCLAVWTAVVALLTRSF
jgi:hypothetical protein